MTIKDYFTDPGLWLLAGLFLLALFLVNNTASTRGYHAGLSVGHAQGRTAVIQANNQSVHTAIKDAYVLGCTDALQAAVQVMGLSDSQYRYDINQACVEDAQNVPYYNFNNGHVDN